MKKTKFLTIFLALCLAAALIPALPARALTDPEIESRAAVVMDRTTGEVYFAREPDARIYPASTTKIMTVLLAVEAVEAGNVALADEVTAGPSMSFDLIPDGSSAGIVEGETMSLEYLLYCAMLSSANEACNVIAEYVAGSISGFVERMNARASELGCTGTHFANTHGLPDEAHYSTPADFCKIAMEASRHDLFMRICNTASMDIPATNKSSVRNLANSNALISQDSIYGSGYYYPDAAGMKTGFTTDAGYCLISTANREEIHLLAAVFGGAQKVDEAGEAHYTNFSDSIALYEWVFANFSYQDILDPSESLASVDVNLGKDVDYVNLRPAGSVSLLLPNDYDPSDFDLKMNVYAVDRGEKVTAPITSGEVLGEVSVYRNGINCGTVKLVAASSVDLSRTAYILSHLRETAQTRLFRNVVIAIAVILVLYLIWVIIYRIKVIRYRRALRRARKQAARNRAAVPAAPRTAPDVEFFPEDGGVPDANHAAAQLPQSADGSGAREKAGRKKKPRREKAKPADGNEEQSDSAKNGAMVGEIFFPDESFDGAPPAPEDSYPDPYPLQPAAEAAPAPEHQEDSYPATEPQDYPYPPPEHQEDSYPATEPQDYPYPPPEHQEDSYPATEPQDYSYPPQEHQEDSYPATEPQDYSYPPQEHQDYPYPPQEQQEDSYPAPEEQNYSYPSGEQQDYPYPAPEEQDYPQEQPFTPAYEDYAEDPSSAVEPPAPRRSPAQPEILPDDPLSMLHDQAARDYFEEFFRPKK